MMHLHLSRRSGRDETRFVPGPDGDLFQTLVENGTNTIFLIDLATEECLYVSPSVQDLLALDPQAMVGRPLVEFVHPDDAPQVLARSHRRRTSQGPRTTVTRMAHGEGRWVWVQATTSPVLSYRGRSATVFTVTGASERVRAETGLRAARQRLRDLLDQVGTGESLRQRDGSHDLTVEALTAALELRDDETVEHARRVADLAMTLTNVVDPNLASDPELRHGFLLHDIGKIGIPDSILLKRSELTPRELRTVQMHTTLGEHLLSFIPFVSDLAHDVVAYHHERWDGSGYPWGLSGEEIPLVARIFAVVDTFDAITSDRPYRQARSISVAIQEIQTRAGTHFDPAIVEAFLPIAFGFVETTLVPLPPWPPSHTLTPGVVGHSNGPERAA
jgi:PAS domain S-box-containing protein